MFTAAFFLVLSHNHTHTHTHTRMHARTHTHTQTHPYLGSLSSILIKHHHWMAIKGHNYGTKGCGCACCGYFTITWMRIQNKQDTQRPLCSNVVYKNPLYTLHLCFPRSVLDEMLKMKTVIYLIKFSFKPALVNVTVPFILWTIALRWIFS